MPKFLVNWRISGTVLEIFRVYLNHVFKSKKGGNICYQRPLLCYPSGYLNDSGVTDAILSPFVL